MRRLSALVLMAGLLLSGCKDKINTQKTLEEPPPPASVVETGNPKVANQLIGGFYGIESNAWRWTARQFRVALGIPKGAAAKGASMKVDFAYPEPSFKSLGVNKISALVKDKVVASTAVNKEGSATWTFDVEPALLTGRDLEVLFVLDKAVPPSAAEARELGVVANRFELSSK